MQRMRFVAIMGAIALCAMLSGCPSAPDGLEKRTVTIGETQRTFELFVPPQALTKGNPPLVIALHRFAETGAGMARLTGFNEIAKREGFIVAYPDAVNRSFNAFGETSVDDIAFLEAIIDSLEIEWGIDRSRVYLTGASNGGFMTYRAACERPGLFAAVAPVMATMPVEVANNCMPNPVPILLIHGTADDFVPYDAAFIEGPPGTMRAVLPIPDVVDFWIAKNGASPNVLIEELPNKDFFDGTTVQRRTYAGGEGGGDVVLYTVRNGGHTWPGGNDALPAILVGRTSKDFKASEVIWEFFSGQ